MKTPLQEPEIITALLLAFLTLAGMVVGLARSRGAGLRWPWRCMLVATLLLGSGYLVIFAALVSMKNPDSAPFGLSSSSMDTWVVIGIALGAGLLGGFALFIGSFLAMGLRTSRIVRRTAELETLAASMRAELAYRQQTRAEH